MRPILLLRAAVVVFLALFAIGLGSASFWVATIMTSPAPRKAVTPPTEIPFKVFRKDYSEGLKISGWAARNTKTDVGILLLHGFRGHRGHLVDRSQFLFDAGYSVVLIDLPSHGESEGKRITLGFDESLGVIAASEYMKVEMGLNRVGVIGSSLGGAAVLLGDKDRSYDAVVLEAVFTDIRKAVGNRLYKRLGIVGTLASPLLLCQIWPRFGFSFSDLSPIQNIRKLKAPVLVIGGEIDDRTTKDETIDLFNAANEPKELWIVPKASHVDMHRHGKEAYRKRVLSFFQSHLPTDSRGSSA